jgi:BirA family biotin operon repressor/biotin-[acetyl-CoA-carboxylase] ligase
MVFNRKISGVLLETGIKGEELSYCIAGIGINVNQEIFREYHPEAVSVKMLTGKHTEPDLVLGSLNKWLKGWFLSLIEKPDEVYQYYERHLYLKGCPSEFIIHGNRVSAAILNADNEGNLLIQTGQEEILKLKHGEFQYSF